MRAQHPKQQGASSVWRKLDPNFFLTDLAKVNKGVTLYDL